MRARKVYGDVQTPPRLAAEISEWLAHHRAPPATVVEPTCGIGAFLEAAAEHFPKAELLGIDLNPRHLADSQERCPQAELRQGDAFAIDWPALFKTLSAPRLVLGNPPWSTTSVQGMHSISNRPDRSPHPLRGYDAITGRSNFDISEWLVTRWLEALGENDTLLMIVKRSVARRLLRRHASSGYAFTLIDIDAKRDFQAAVEASVFTAWRSPAPATIRHRRSFDAPASSWILADGELVTDPDAIDAASDIVCLKRSKLQWRSGVKHDCRDIFELRRSNGSYASAVETAIELEPDVVFPLIRASDLARGGEPSRSILITHRSLQETPEALATSAPFAHAYLRRNHARLARRKSRVYRARPDYVQFGIGEYTFAPFKVAVSALHWPPRFRALAPIGGQPVILDDTSYALACENLAEAESLATLYNRREVRFALGALTDRNAKRPITKSLLQHLRAPKLHAEDGAPRTIESECRST